MFLKCNIFVLLFFLNLSVNAQVKGEYKVISKEEAVKTLQKINKWFSATPSYSFAVTHTSYVGHNSSVVHEQKRGYFKKFKEGFHSYMVGINTIQNKNFSVTIDTTSKIILVSDPLKNFEGNKLSMDEYLKLLDKCMAIKQVINNDNSVTVRMEFGKNSSVTAYEFVIGKTELLQAITIYYANEVKTLDGKMAKPKLHIAFESYASSIPFTKNELDESQYFSLSKTTLVKKDKYKEYELLDQRLGNDKL